VMLIAVVAMFIAVIVCAHGMMIVRTILCARQYGGQPYQSERGQCC
jgi:hypothetical protein